MPDPSEYKDKAKFMEDCMHMQKAEKGSLKDDKKRSQAVGKCIGMWRGNKGGKKPPKKKRMMCASYYLRQAASTLERLLT